MDDVLLAIFRVLTTEIFGNVTLIVALWLLCSVIGLVCNAIGWIEARVDYESFGANRGRYDPRIVVGRLRELGKDVRNEWLGLEVQLVFVGAGLIYAYAQWVAPPAIVDSPQYHPSLFSVLGPILFMYAESRLVWGSLKNRVDRAFDESLQTTRR